MIEIKTLRQCFNDAKNFASKLDTYFEVYEDFLGPLRGKPITLVEIGVLDGGSLQMWRSYLGNQARIIGIEANQEATKVADQGFEIYIGNQENGQQLDAIFSQIGPIDILIDDGGHTSRGQIQTCLSAAKFMAVRGLIIIEDTHSSYASDFGMPSKYSFANWVNRVCCFMDSEYLNPHKIGSSPTAKFANRVRRIIKFKSMTVFEIGQTSRHPTALVNKSLGENSKDMRWANESKFFKILLRLEDLTHWRMMSIGATRQPKVGRERLCSYF